MSAGATFICMTSQAVILGFYKSFILNFIKLALPYFLSEMTVNSVYKPANIFLLLSMQTIYRYLYNEHYQSFIKIEVFAMLSCK